MAMNNAYRIYCILIEIHTKGIRFLSMGEAIKEMTHSFCKQESPIQMQRAEHPLHESDLTNVFDPGTGRKICTDAHGEVATSLVAQTVKAMTPKRGITLIQKKSPWRTHQSVAQIKKDHYN